MKREALSLYALIGLLVVAAALLPRAAAAQVSDEEAVVELIVARLAVMKEVAAYKYGNDLPIEDRDREAVVLDKSVEKAEALGLDGASVLPFFAQQIEAAKSIQACWMARWREGSETALRFPRDLQTELRPQLIEIGNKLGDTLAAALADGEALDAERLDDARTQVSLDCLTTEKLDAVLASLRAVKSAGP
ncbi:MAG TPA: gamma subclass chorismate mutase AroQ [Kiloniellaceae bacterium]|nr:gamma subclass chorismate mutase AroQ [Kiloniellaceae bacterium]